MGPDLSFDLTPDQLDDQNRDLSWPSFCSAIVPRVTALIELPRAGISHLQRLPASITRAAI